MMTQMTANLFIILIKSLKSKCVISVREKVEFHAFKIAANMVAKTADFREWMKINGGNFKRKDQRLRQSLIRLSKIVPYALKRLSWAKCFIRWSVLINFTEFAFFSGLSLSHSAHVLCVVSKTLISLSNCCKRQRYKKEKEKEIPHKIRSKTYSTLYQLILGKSVIAKIVSDFYFILFIYSTSNINFAIIIMSYHIIGSQRPTYDQIPSYPQQFSTQMYQPLQQNTSIALFHIPNDATNSLYIDGIPNDASEREVSRI